MPFSIIRDDITKVRADAIVNTANPQPRYAAGTDAAVYMAAGAQELLAERRKIGPISPGEAAVTAAFSLPAKYIIHTVGPEWIDGEHGEYEILRSCYRKSMLLADQLGCGSIAFPLIATGVYGFPKDRALEIALSVIKEHLEDSDLDVILVVFDRSSYQIASGLVEQALEYIDENYVAAQLCEEYEAPSAGAGAGRRRNERRRIRENLNFGGLFKEAAPSAAMPYEGAADESASAMPYEEAAAAPEEYAKKPSLEFAVRNLGESFQARLLRMIDERGMTDPEVYKRANLDRKLFSKIRCNEDYIPKKKTIIALAIALRLNLDDTKDLLASAGLALTNSSKSDVILSFCIENGIYDIFEVNALLFKFDEPVLG